MKTGIYIRVSTGDQSNSLDMQLAKCKQFCEFQNREIVEVFTDEDVSAAKNFESRPGGQKLIKAIRRGDIKSVVSFKLDRMFRSVTDGLLTIEDWYKKGISIALLDYGGHILDTSSPTSKAFVTVMLTMAELERNMTADRTKQVLNYKKSRLEVYSGSIPYGFRKKYNKLVPEPKEMEKVKRIFDLHAQGLNYTQIQNEVVIPSYKVSRILKNYIYKDFV